MVTTIPFIAYEISGVKQPTYGSGAANKAYVDAQVVAAGGVTNGAFQALTASTGITPFTSTVKVSSSTAQSISILGYSTISSNAKSATAIAGSGVKYTLAYNWFTQSSNALSVHENDSTLHTTTTQTAKLNSIAASGVKYTLAYNWFVESSNKLSNHENDTTVLHTTTAEKEKWNEITASGVKYTSAYKSAQASKVHAFHAKISSSYLAANYGWANITSGSKRIAHNLSGTPNFINITPSGMITFAYAVYNPNSVNFTVAITAAGSRDIKWNAHI